MTLKKYLRPEEAAEYLSKQTGHSITVRDLFDLVLEKKILPVFLKDCALIHYGRDYDDGKKQKAYFYWITAFFYLDDCNNRLVMLSGRAKSSVAFLYENLDFESFGLEEYYLRGTRCYISSASLVGLLSGEFPVLEQWEMNVGQDENPVLFQLDQAMYPRAELDALIAKHNAMPEDEHFHNLQVTEQFATAEAFDQANAMMLFWGQHTYTPLEAAALMAGKLPHEAKAAMAREDFEGASSYLAQSIRFIASAIDAGTLAHDEKRGILRRDLQAFFQRHKITVEGLNDCAEPASPEPAPQQTEAPPEALNPKARTTAQQIIAALASYPDALDLTQPYKAAEILIAHADSTGQPIPSKQTVAQWLKDANPK